MENQNFFSENSIFLGLELNSQDEVFSKISDLAKNFGVIKKKKKLIKDFYKREKLATTVFEAGFALPHARSNNIISASVFVLRLKNSIIWNSQNDDQINIIIAIMIPKKDQNNTHITILSAIAQKLIDPKIKNLLKESTDKKEIISFLNSSL